MEDNALMKAVLIWCAMCVILIAAALAAKTFVGQGYAMTALLMVTGGGIVYLICKR